MAHAFVDSTALLFVFTFAFDCSAAFLWHAGKKERLYRRKRKLGQRWIAYRLWVVSTILKCVLFYAAFFTWAYTGALN